MANNTKDKDDLKLAQAASQGNREFQQAVYALIQPVLDF
ncbi:MAG: hypothetical protein ACI9KN_000147, partial [Gammaproteobacteria bacterium]